ncbi:tyrosine-type recombinase/integrase [Cytobacillus gottheilii]|uniref:tyrosine-type recombinase/integrase n=1 Tax=Cytobacillus gottheilii TaxID=859144 RepID=UPI0009BBB82F|nr:site-specific integrase [Cytobacillus gottheilii]
MQSNVIKLENEHMKSLDIINHYFSQLTSSHRDFEGERTDRTKCEYESDLRQFFLLMRNKQKGKELEFLYLDELSIQEDEFKEYIETLQAIKKPDDTYLYTNKTINRKISALKKYVRFLKDKKYIKDDVSYLIAIKGTKERSLSYGALEAHEVLKMAELARLETHYPREKRLMLLLSFKTGLRRDEIFNLTWDSFVEREDGVEIQFVGKGYEDFQIKISKEFYQEIRETLNDKEALFEMDKKTVTNMMNKFTKKLGISPKRRIVFHSVRKAFGSWIFETTGDINQARKALRHKSIVTTQLYLNAKDLQLHNTLFGIEKLDEDLYKETDHEVLLRAISELPKSHILMLNSKISEINKLN